MKRGHKALQLTAPGGPFGWPGLPTGVSFEDARQALSRRTPAPVYVLGIDQAQRSGWAVHDTLKVVAHGATKSTPEQVAALEQLRSLPGFDWQHVLVIFEDHRKLRREALTRFDAEHGRGPERQRDDTVALALGDARGGWRVLLDLRNQPKAQRILVAPSEWRRVLKGARFGAADDWKSAALRWAQSCVSAEIDDDNEAEACAISTWGACDGLYAWARGRLRDNADKRGAL